MTEVEFGHVLIVGGAPGSAGAAALAGLAALRSGAGRVTVACPRSVAAIVAAYGAALLTHALPETDRGGIAATAAEEIGELLVGKRAVVVGPGLSLDPETTLLVSQLIAGCQIPLVITGAALAAVAANHSTFDCGNERGSYRVICADVNEVGQWLGKLLGNEGLEPPDLARSISSMTGACVVLGSSRTVVAGPCGESWINLSGGPAVAKAGMSEVLGGVMGAVLARSPEPDMPGCASPAFHVRFLRDLHVAAAVHLHGLAADIAGNRSHEHALMAENVLEALPEAFSACDRQAESGLFYIRT
jgi:NAD(P)H-hydrate epimerase